MSSDRGKTQVSDWSILVGAAKRALEEQGYQLDRLPGRGLSNVWNIACGGKSQTASIRTTRNRWFAFPPLAGGTKWKTLDDVDLVAVAAMDSEEAPERVEVYLFDAKEVRKRFEAAYVARTSAGQLVRDDFGMWICLDADARGMPISIGSGLADKVKPLAAYALKELRGTDNSMVREYLSTVAQRQSAPECATISDVMAWARQRVSEIAGVAAEAVKLELKIEY